MERYGTGTGKTMICLIRNVIVASVSFYWISCMLTYFVSSNHPWETYGHQHQLFSRQSSKCTFTWKSFIVCLVSTYKWQTWRANKQLQWRECAIRFYHCCRGAPFSIGNNSSLGLLIVSSNSNIRVCRVTPLRCSWHSVALNMLYKHF